MKQQYKFEKLQVWQLSLDFSDIVYQIISKLPEAEKFNLSSQFCRAATSVSLNIAEGSTSSSNAEQKRYILIAIRSYIESYACFLIILHRKFIEENSRLSEHFQLKGNELFAKLQAFKKSLS